MPLKPQPSAHGEIQISSITIPKRLRELDHKFIDEELMPSIAEVGLLQPILLASDEHTLIAGGHRIQAMLNLGYSNIVYNTREQVSESDQLVMEYEENDIRLSMDWKAKARSIRTIHRKKKLESSIKGEKWGVRQAGKLLGVAYGYVSEFVCIADQLDKGDPGLETCSTVSEAFKYMYAKKEDEAHKSLAALAKGSPTSHIPTKQISSGPVEFSLDLSKPVTNPIGSTSEQTEYKGFNVPISERFIKGDCLEVMKAMEPEQFDLVFTDIPYGIAMANLDGIDGVDRVEQEHDVDQNVAQMKGFLEGSYRVLKDKSWLIFYFDLIHFEKLIQWSEEVGFKVQTYPLHWIKTHPCRNQSSHCSWTKTIEHVFVARKGTATMRNNSYSPNHFSCDGMVAKKEQANPFAKPFEMCEWILDKVVFQGQSCLDPFAGEGSICKAEIVKGLVPYGIELSDTHYDRLCNNVRAQYSKMGGDKVTFS